ncbi:aa3-type cytochrome c oxidase subunit IV [Shinella curvata]|uniref:Aa3-type cytochrome c oxidase subunit IV n=1 Tax=Shinella curvata TaxID=1817964 RepID=A0ABT8XEB2_9HYPH|nr:aa3-type cytochrome c oxidase subunit IV [Shinella curvata]MCJ8055541.1 aa3-type cytochrome c oxidase subunit IV [Shinella curvata]MDO6121958.1 aa3-type cytochrome c oxidase subunit IV [Shinella curvata]
MAEHHSGPVEMGAPMDYPEHEKTYNLFVNGAKYGTLFCVALLVAMAAGFFTGAGFFSALLLLIILNVLGFIVLR